MIRLYHILLNKTVESINYIEKNTYSRNDYLFKINRMKISKYIINK